MSKLAREGQNNTAPPRITVSQYNLQHNTILCNCVLMSPSLMGTIKTGPLPYPYILYTTGHWMNVEQPLRQDIVIYQIL